MAQQKSQNSDGGYYAIKGFVFQFDKSLLEILRTNAEVEIEHIQDLSYKNYYIQIKHKETQTYSSSKISKAVAGLLNESEASPDKKFILYAYFKDKAESRWVPDLFELNTILGSKSTSYTDATKNTFLSKFVIVFAPNFLKQFGELIKEIKKAFVLKSDEEAVGYHAFLQHGLISLAIKKRPQDRKINKKRIIELARKHESAIFHSGYRRHLGQEKYLAYIKKEFFTQKKTNFPNHERVFIIDADDGFSEKSVIAIATALSKKYYKLDISPAPYLCLLGYDYKKLAAIKQKLWDKKVVFTDGTHFAGDRFRMEDLIADTNNQKNPKILKILPEDYLSQFLKKDIADEMYYFFKSGQLKKKNKNFIEISLERPTDILSLIK